MMTGSGKRARLSILGYHRVLPEPDPMFDGDVDAKQFEAQMSVLVEQFNVLPLTEAIDRLGNGTLPARAACLTFDDGYADNVDVALPILQHYGLPATFFISSGFLNGDNMWNDTIKEALRNASVEKLDMTSRELGAYALTDMDARLNAAKQIIGKLKYLPYEERHERVNEVVEAASGARPGPLMMSADGVKTLHAAGMEIGGHTVTHPILNSLDATSARDEMADGRSQLEDIIGEKVTLFAYPNGKPEQDYRAEHVDILKQLGFRAALSTAWGTSARGTDPYQLPRFTPWDKEPLRFALRLLHNTTRRNIDSV